MAVCIMSPLPAGASLSSTTAPLSFVPSTPFSGFKAQVGQAVPCDQEKELRSTAGNTLMTASSSPPADPEDTTAKPLPSSWHEVAVCLEQIQLETLQPSLTLKAFHSSSPDTVFCTAYLESKNNSRLQEDLSPSGDSIPAVHDTSSISWELESFTSEDEEEMVEAVSIKSCCTELDNALRTAFDGPSLGFFADVGFESYGQPAKCKHGAASTANCTICTLATLSCIREECCPEEVATAISTDVLLPWDI